MTRSTLEHDRRPELRQAHPAGVVICGESAIELIESIKDERIALARSLTTRSGRVAAGRCLIEGATLIRQIVVSGAVVDFALCPEDGDDPEASAELDAASVPVHPVRSGLLRKLTGAGRHGQWLAVA